MKHLFSFLLIGIGLNSAAAFPSQSQAVKPLTYSKKLFVMDYYKPDSIFIHNPNSSTVKCDSMEVWGEQSKRGGLMILKTAVGTSQPTYLFMRFSPDSRDVDVDGFNFEKTFTAADLKLVFPAQKDLIFGYDSFDACPTCKISATNSSQDTVRFKLVFHYSGFADTVRATMPAKEGVSVRRPAALDRPEFEKTFSGVTDIRGRRLVKRTTASPVFARRLPESS